MYSPVETPMAMGVPQVDLFWMTWNTPRNCASCTNLPVYTPFILCVRMFAVELPLKLPLVREVQRTLLSAKRQARRSVASFTSFSLHATEGRILGHSATLKVLTL